MHAHLMVVLLQSTAS